MCMGETPKSWLSTESYEQQDNALPENSTESAVVEGSGACGRDSANGDDGDEETADTPASQPQSPAALPAARDDVCQESPRRGFRDRGQLRRPARFRD